MGRFITFKDVLLMCLLISLFILRFDILMAILLGLITGVGILAVKRRLTK